MSHELQADPSRPAAAARTRGRRTAIAAAFGVFCAAIALAASSGEPLTRVLSYDGPTYLEVARQVAQSGTLPPLDTRTPLYPSLLALAQWLSPARGLEAVVMLQLALRAGTATLLYALVARLAGQARGVAAGIAFCTLTEVLSTVRLIYPEILASFLAVAAAAAVVAGGTAADAWGYGAVRSSRSRPPIPGR